MSALTEILDDMAKELAETMSKEQLAKLTVGYFAAVETWEVSKHEPDGLVLFHSHVKKKFTGGKL